MNQTASDNGFLDQVHSLLHSLKHHMHEAMRQEGDGLGMMEARCLRYYAHNAGHTQHDLVQHSGRDKAQIARIVKALMERGLLQSEPNPADGRSQVLSVSTKGHVLQNTLRAHQAAFENQLMAGISKSEQATLMTLLARIKANTLRD